MAGLGGPSLNDLGDIFSQYHAVGHQAAMQVPAFQPAPAPKAPPSLGQKLSAIAFHNPIEHSIGNFASQAYHNPLKTATGIGTNLLKADRAIARPAVSVARGQFGKAAHDTAQLSQDLTGGTLNTFARGVQRTPQMVAADVTNNPKAQASTQRKAFGTTDSGTIAKKIAAGTAGTASLFVGGGAAGRVAKTGLGKALNVAKSSGKFGAAGAVGNASATVNQNPSATKGQIAKSAAVGFGVGAALPVAGSLLGKAVNRAAGVKTVQPNSPASALDGLVEQVNKAQADAAKAKQSPSPTKTATKTTTTPVETKPVVGQGSVQTPNNVNKPNAEKGLVPVTPPTQGKMLNYDQLVAKQNAEGFNPDSPNFYEPTQGANVPAIKNLSASAGGKDAVTSFKPEEPNSITETGTHIPSKQYAPLKSLEGSQQQELGYQLHASHDFKQMDANATKLVSENPTGARDMFLNRELVKDNPDAHAKLGNALFDHAVKNAQTTEDLNKSVAPIWRELQTSRTQAGQGLAAWKVQSMVSPEGIVKYAQKVADMKGKSLDVNQIRQLQDIAKKVQGMEDSPMKAQVIQAMKELADNKSWWERKVQLGKEIMSLPRAIMASTDLSFGLRQGALLGARHPVLLGRAMANSAKYMFSQKAFDEGMSKIANATDRHGEALMPVFKRMGIDLEGVEGKAEEVFGSRNLAEHMPGNNPASGAYNATFAKVIKGSDRAFTGAAADLRSSVAKQIVDGYGGVKAVTENWTGRDLRDLGRVINTMTGRGHGGLLNPSNKDSWFEKAAPSLGQTLFSARLWKSRLDMLNPVFYATLKGPAKKEALQSALAFGTLVSTTLAAAAAAGAKVETDPTSSDFGKIKVGNTRVDIMGGLQQNIVTAAREIEGKTKSSTTGATTSLNNKYGGPTRLSVLYSMIQNKETPTLGTTSRILGAGNGGPQVTNPWGEIAKLFIPLGPSDIYQATKDSGAKGAAISATTVLGTGIQTYSAQQTTDWNKNPGKQLTQFKSSVGQQKFDQANQDYNKAVTQWYKDNLNSAKYKAIPDDQKNAYITKNKNEIKSKIYKQYGFTYHKQK